MTNRIKLMLAVVAVLVGVNIWRWWPQAESPERSTAAADARVTDVFDLRLAGHESLDNKAGRIKRDLFAPVSVTKPVVEVKKPVVKPVKKPREIQSQQNRILKELEEFQLMGILLRNGIKRAFLTRKEENFTVTRGDRIDKIYIVDDVTLTSVTLSEAESRISKKIELE